MKRLCFLLSINLILGCGVKGDPIPPKSTKGLGRGKPTFRRAIEESQLDDISSERNEDYEDEREDKDSER